MRNLDVNNDTKNKRAFVHKEGNVVIYNTMTPAAELVVYLEDGEVVASIYNRKSYNGTQDVYNLQTYGDDSKIAPFLRDEKAVPLDEPKTYDLDGRIFKEHKVTKESAPYPMKKLNNLVYTTQNDLVSGYSESYKEKILETLPVDAIENNYKIVKKGKQFIRQYGEPVKRGGKIVKDDNGEPETKSYHLDWILEKDYRILTEDDEIHEFIDGLAKTENLVGFDTETTGFRIHRFKTDKLVGICMSYEDNTGVYFPFEHKKFGNVKMGKEKLLELLKPYCDARSPLKKDLIAHNGSFDWKVLKMYGWDTNIVHDTYILFSLLDITSNKYIRSLKGIAKDIFKFDTLDLDEIFYKLDKEAKDAEILDFRYMNEDLARLYCGFDADAPRLLYEVAMNDWDSELDYVYALEMKVMKAAASQEFHGMKIDLNIVKELEDEATERIKVLIEEIYELAGEQFSISSPKQKQEIIYEKLGLPKLARFKTKTGYSTAKDALEYFSEIQDEHGEKKYPIMDRLLEYSEVSQKLKLFYSKIPKMADRGFIFPSYNQLGTETGRFSSSKPNLQQTEQPIRRAMLPESDDYYFLICDYSQVEYRLSAGLHGETKVIDFFSDNPEADYHIMAYSNMMNIPYEEVTGKQRGEGKTLNFAISYGLQAPNLAIKLYGDDSDIYQQKAIKQQEKYFEGVPNIRDHTKVIENRALAEGYISTLFGRKRYIEEFAFIDKYGDTMSDYRKNTLIASGKRKAGNTFIQGTAADILKMAMVACHDRFEKEGLDMKIIANVHDEMTFQVHKSINMWYAIKLVRECMEIDLSRYNIPPLYIGANIGYSWADGKVDELEAPVILMDRKGKAVDKALKLLMNKHGITEREAADLLPKSEDPRTEFRDDLVKFVFDVILEETQANGYTYIDHVLEDKRIRKYVGTYLIPYIKDKQPDITDERLNVVQAVIVGALMKVQDRNKVWDKLPQLLVFESFKYKKPPKVEAEQDEEVVSLQERIEQSIEFKRDAIRVLDTQSERAFVSGLQDLVAPIAMKRHFPDDMKHYKLTYVDVVDDITHTFTGVIFECFIPILKQLVQEHYTTGIPNNRKAYRLLEQEFERVAQENLK